MRLVAGWAHMMSTHVSVAPRTGVDSYGKPTYGTAKSYQAHIGRDRMLVRMTTGELVEAGVGIWLATTDAILPTAQITLSTADAGSTDAAALNPTIRIVRRLSDQGGPHHVYVEVQ